MRTILLTGAVLATTLAARVDACSQCMCGMPFPSDVLGGVVPMQLSFGFEERYLSKSNALEAEPGNETQREHRLAAFGLWRPWDRLALLGRLPYNFKEITERPEGGGTTVENTTGLGDAELLALAGLVSAAGRLPATLGLVVGVTAPTGSNNAENTSGERLDAHLQPGTGAWSGTFGLHLAVSFAPGIWDASLMGRLNGTSSHDYHYSNTLLFNAGFMSRAWKNMHLLAQINGRSAERDHLEDGTTGEHTGGTVIYAAPGLSWRTGLGLTLEGSVQVPFYEALYGIQDEHTTGRFMLSMTR